MGGSADSHVSRANDVSSRVSPQQERGRTVPGCVLRSETRGTEAAACHDGDDGTTGRARVRERERRGSCQRVYRFRRQDGDDSRVALEVRASEGGCTCALLASLSLFPCDTRQPFGRLNRSPRLASIASTRSAASETANTLTVSPWGASALFLLSSVCFACRALLCPAACLPSFRLLPCSRGLTTRSRQFARERADRRRASPSVTVGAAAVTAGAAKRVSQRVSRSCRTEGGGGSARVQLLLQQSRLTCTQSQWQESRWQGLGATARGKLFPHSPAALVVKFARERETLLTGFHALSLSLSLPPSSRVCCCCCSRACGCDSTHSLIQTLVVSSKLTASLFRSRVAIPATPADHANSRRRFSLAFAPLFR